MGWRTLWRRGRLNLPGPQPRGSTDRGAGWASGTCGAVPRPGALWDAGDAPEPPPPPPPLPVPPEGGRPIGGAR